MRRLGLHRINDSVVKDDRPEIRGMIAKVRHLVRVEEVETARPEAAGGRGRKDVVKLHHLKPAEGAKKDRKRVGRGRAGVRGQDRGPGHEGLPGASHNPKPGFEGGQMPLQRRVPKLKGFTNPNRVEFAVVNVETLAKYFDGRGRPDGAARARPGPQGPAREGPRARRDRQGAHRPRSRVQRGGEGEDRGGRRHGRGHRTTRGRIGTSCSAPSSTRSRSRTSGTRSSSRCSSSPSTGSARTCRSRWWTSTS